MEERYHVRLPRKVVALDYGRHGDLYIRFKHVERPVGEPTKDGNAILFYEDGEGIIAIEILVLKQLM